MTMVGRLVAHKKDMAAAVTTTAVRHRSGEEPFLVSADL
jgi:hypothetical protein